MAVHRRIHAAAQTGREPVPRVRQLELDPEACLRHANLKFARRFAAVEAALAARGMSAAEASLEEMEAAWGVVKAGEPG